MGDGIVGCRNSDGASWFVTKSTQGLNLGVDLIQMRSDAVE
jgi:hypothetical protein